MQQVMTSFASPLVQQLNPFGFLHLWKMMCNCLHKSLHFKFVGHIFISIHPHYKERNQTLVASRFSVCNTTKASVSSFSSDYMYKYMHMWGDFLKNLRLDCHDMFWILNITVLLHSTLKIKPQAKRAVIPFLNKWRLYSGHWWSGQ